MPEKAATPPFDPPSTPGLAWTGISDKRSYYKLFLGYVTGIFATGITTVALAVLIFDLSREGEDAGAVTGTLLSLKMLAYAVAAPIATALTERMRRKTLLIELDLIRGACVLLLLFAGAIWQIWLLVLTFALASATFSVVYLTAVPYLLGSEGDYTRSLVRSRIAAELESSVSLLLAAGLLLLLPLPAVIAAMAGGFLLSALLVAAADLPLPRPVQPGRMWGRVLRGPRLMLRMPELRALIALDAVAAVASAMVMVNTVVLVQGVFGRGHHATAVAYGIFGAGAIAGALFLPAVLARVSERVVMLAGALLATGALLAGATVSTLYPVVLLWLMLGLGISLTLTPAIYLIRRVAPPRDLQTLFAAQFSLSNAFLPFAYPAAGWLGAALGLQAASALLGLVAGAATLAAFLLGPRRRPSREEEQK